MGKCRQEEMNDEEIEKANRLMILFDNIRKMDDTEIVVFIHNLAHYLYDKTKGDLYLIMGKELKRLETSQEKIDKSIECLNYYIEGMNESIELWNKVKENEKIEDNTLLQMLEKEKQNYINVLYILKGSDKE